MTFAADVRRFTEKTEKGIDKTVRAITFALFREVIQRTPVGDPDRWKVPAPPGYVGGRLKGNWQASVNAPVSGTVTTTDRSGATTIANMATAIGGWGSTTFLSNNLPYAQRIEYDGWSKVKSPQGMVRVSLARINSIVARAARDNKV